MPGRKFYAVAAGREGPRIYSEWTQCEKAVIGFPNAAYKSFASLPEAEAYMQNPPPRSSPVVNPRYYAVRVKPRGENQIFRTWSETQAFMEANRCYTNKAFATEEEARDWLLRSTQHALETQTSRSSLSREGCMNGQMSISRQASLDNLSSGSTPPFELSSNKENTIQSSMLLSQNECDAQLDSRHSPYPSGSSSAASSTSNQNKRKQAPSSFSRPSRPSRPNYFKPSTYHSAHAFVESPAPQRPAFVSASQMLESARPIASTSQPGFLPSSSGSQEDPVNLLSSDADMEEVIKPTFSDLYNHDSLAPKLNNTKRAFGPNEDCIPLDFAPVASTSTLSPCAAQVPEAPAGPPLSAEQTRILDRVMRGESIFFTGSAGVGKSVLTRAIIAAMRAKYPGKNTVAVTATTGIAATNIEGCTLHSWAGVGLGKGPVEKLYWPIIKAKGLNEKKARWQQCQVLIIDEVSMLDGKFFDKLETIARMVRQNSAPFGGIQLVITGDFFQLPPVPDYSGPGQPKIPITFAFNANTWNTCIQHTAVLKQVYRQKDQTFVNLLNELRAGRLSPLAIKTFGSLARPVKYEDEIEPTCLYPKRDQVAQRNAMRLTKLPGNEVIYTSTDNSGRDPETGQHYYPEDERLTKFLNSNTLVERSMTLKVGAQVMLVKNLTMGHVNGTLGKVLGFASGQDIRAARLAFSQGSIQENVPQSVAAKPDEASHTHDAVLRDLENDLTVKSEEGVNAMLPAPAVKTEVVEQQSTPVKHERGDAESYMPEQITPASNPAKAVEAPVEAPAQHPIAEHLVNIRVGQAKLTEREKRARNMDEGDDDEYEENVPPGHWPVVQFKNGRTVLLPKMDFEVQNSAGVTEACRQQVPLILAWALSIHKSQGQTLERVKVDMGEIFEAGQGYVALSRATRLESLQVIRFRPEKIRVSPVVVKWYQGILNAAKAETQ